MPFAAEDFASKRTAPLVALLLLSIGVPTSPPTDNISTRCLTPTSVRFVARSELVFGNAG
jgi:hypothetical protein